MTSKLMDDLLQHFRDELLLWHDQFKTRYATICAPDGALIAHERIDSEEFELFIRREAHDKLKAHLAPQQMVHILSLLAAGAAAGPSHRTAIRVGEWEGKIYVDRASPDKPFIEISRKGWRLVDASPVKFIRKPGMQALPEPARKGSFTGFWEHTNLTPDGRKLCIGWLIAAALPVGPYPILFLLGEQGSGKSTLARALRKLVDPHSSLLRSAPENERDLAVLAKNSWVVAFDNVSVIRSSLQDALARMSTGGAFSVRKLYTDDAETLIEIQRPMEASAIDLKINDDVRDRSIVLECAPIPDSQRISEEHFWKEFDESWSSNLGALMDALVASFGKDRVEPPAKLPRMADWALTMSACESALGWEAGDFLRIYWENRRESTETLLNQSNVAVAIRKLLEDGPIECTASELLQTIRETSTVPSARLPGDPKNLAIELRRLAPAFRDTGVEIEFRHGKQRLIKIQKLSDDADDAGDAECGRNISAADADSSSHQRNTSFLRNSINKTFNEMD